MIQRKAVVLSEKGLDARIAIYIRDWKKRKAIKSKSLNAEKAAVHRYLKSLQGVKGWRSMKTILFVDHSKPGKDPRPVFLEMLEGVCAQKFTHVITLKFDHFAASLSQWSVLSKILAINETTLLLNREDFRSSYLYREIKTCNAATVPGIEYEEVSDNPQGSMATEPTRERVLFHPTKGWQIERS